VELKDLCKAEALLRRGLDHLAKSDSLALELKKLDRVYTSFERRAAAEALKARRAIQASLTVKRKQ